MNGLPHETDPESDNMNAAVRKIFDQGLGDARVRSISWQGDDFMIELALPPARAEQPSLFLCFRNSSQIRIDMDFGEYIEAPLLFGAEAELIDNRGWSIRFEFGGAPDGEISFQCTEVIQKTHG